jgi:hypothetical protein
MSYPTCPCVGPCTCIEPDTGIPLVNDANAINYGPSSILYWSADPSGQYDSAPALLAAFSFLNNSGTVYIPGGVFSIQTSITVPAGISLQFWGGVLNIANGKSITIKGVVQAPPAQAIFDYDPSYVVQPVVVVSRSVITPYHFGAVGDGVADDTLACQTALNALAQGSYLATTDVYEEGALLTLPQGNFGISNTLLLFNVTGFEINGISRTGSSFRWIGTTAGLPMLRLLNCTECSVRRLSVIGNSAHQPSIGIESRIDTTLTITYGATGNIFEDLLIGGSGSNEMQKGIAYTYNAAGNDQDNDVGLFRRVEIENCSVAGVSFEMEETISHAFFDCTIVTCVIGVACTLGSGGGQFTWYGGDVSNNTTVDFQLDGQGNCLISGAQCESSASFLKTAGNPFGGNQTITLSGVRWSGDRLQSNHRWVQIESGMALNVEGCIIGDGATSMPQIYAGLQNSAIPVQVNLIGNHFAMPDSYLYDPIQNGTAASPEMYVYYSGNVYDDVNGEGIRRDQVTVSWSPNIANGATGSTTASLPVHVGDIVGFSVQAAVPAGVILTATPSATGTVQLSVYNASGSTWNPGALNVNFWLECAVRANS